LEEAAVIDGANRFQSLRHVTIPLMTPIIFYQLVLSIVAANWDSMVFDVGRDPLRRVPMMEPLRGTAAHVASLIAESTTAADLLERLGA